MKSWVVCWVVIGCIELLQGQPQQDILSTFISLLPIWCKHDLTCMTDIWCSANKNPVLSRFQGLIPNFKQNCIVNYLIVLTVFPCIIQPYKHINPSCRYNLVVGIERWLTLEVTLSSVRLCLIWLQLMSDYQSGKATHAVCQ